MPHNALDLRMLLNVKVLKNQSREYQYCQQSITHLYLQTEERYNSWSALHQFPNLQEEKDKVASKLSGLMTKLHIFDYRAHTACFDRLHLICAKLANQ